MKLVIYEGRAPDEVLVQDLAHFRMLNERGEGCELDGEQCGKLAEYLEELAKLRTCTESCVRVKMPAWAGMPGWNDKGFIVDDDGVQFGFRCLADVFDLLGKRGITEPYTFETVAVAS